MCGAAMLLCVLLYGCVARCRQGLDARTLLLVMSMAAAELLLSVYADGRLCNVAVHVQALMRESVVKSC